MTPFQRYALAGFAGGVAVTATLGVPPWLIGLLAVGGLVAALAVVLVTRLLTGREMLVYQHHAIAVLGACAAILALIGRPLHPDLDAVALGLGVMLAVGRLGCHAAGCCHGRPARWGVRYSHDHLDGAFPAPLAGVPLFPVALCESALMMAIVAVGAAMVLTHARPGAALAWFVAASACERFALELFRGDTRRHRWMGVTEAQWIALAVAATVALSGAGLAYTIAALVLLVATSGLVLGRGNRCDDRDIAGLAYRLAAAAEGQPCVTVLPCGVLLSAGHIGAARHLTMSGEDARRARRLTRYAERLTPGRCTVEIRSGGGATTHVILRPAGPGTGDANP